MPWIIRIICFVLTTAIFIPIESALAAANTATPLIWLITAVIYFFIYYIPSKALVSMWEKRGTTYGFAHIFEQSIKRSYEALSKTEYHSVDSSLDLFALTYVISDLAVSSSPKRKQIMGQIADYLIKNLFQKNHQIISDFEKRISFYGEVIRGRELHAHCMPIDISSANAIVCCAIAFCDRLVYPTYFSNYDAPEPELDAITTIEVTMDILEPLVDELKTLSEEISKAI